eukprot:g9703.t1
MEESITAGVLTIRDAKRFAVHIEKTLTVTNTTTESRKKRSQGKASGNGRAAGTQKAVSPAKSKPKGQAVPGRGPRGVKSRKGVNAKPKGRKAVTKPNAKSKSLNKSKSTAACKRAAGVLTKVTRTHRLGAIRARLKWTIAMITGRRGMDVRMLNLNDLLVDDKKQATHVRIGDSKIAAYRKKKAPATTSARGKLVWLKCSCEPDTLKWVRSALEYLKERAAKPNEQCFPYKASDPTRGFEAYAKVIRKARASFKTLDKFSCRADQIRSHSSRRSFVTHLHKKGVPLESIAVYTGHKDIETLRRYIETGAEYACECHKELKF